MALAYRAHFAMWKNPLATSKGFSTSAVYGFLTALRRLLDQEKPERICVVFDGSTPTFRHRAYADYKATRQKMPEELLAQLDWIRRVVEAEGIPFVRLEGYEADDVIGTIARREAARGGDVWIVSGDKDMQQLVSDRVRLYDPMRGADDVRIVDAAAVEAKMGVPPDRVVDVLGLMGDSSDNVPGVPGVGDKTAVRLVREHGSLEGALAAAPTLSPRRLGENLAAHAEQALLSKRLVTLDCDVPLDPSLDVLARRERDRRALHEVFTALEFSKLAAEVADAAVEPARPTAYRTVRTPEDVRALVDDLRATKETGGFAIDTETTGVDALRSAIVGLSFAWRPHEACYVPLNCDPPIFGTGPAVRREIAGSLFPGGVECRDVDAVLDLLRPVLEDASIPKTGQNLKYDWLVLAAHGVRLRGIEFDTMVASFCLDPDGRRHDLDSMSLAWLRQRKTPTTDLIGTGRNQVTMLEVDVERVSAYACEDADCTWRLRAALEPELSARGVLGVFREIEMPLLPVLCRMEHAGVRLDVEALAAMGRDLSTRAKALEERLFEAAGEPVNLRSNPQIGVLLFDRLRLHETTGRKRPRRTVKGTGWATDERTLLEFAPHHPIPAMLLEWRMLTKLVSTYVEALPQHVNPRTGRVHTTFHQTGAATGRLSSSEPNLQNIPVRGEEGRLLRTAFVPEEGWTLVSADYSQIELRLLAHLAEDPGLTEAFLAKQDVHRSTAARVFGVAPSEVTPEMRGRAKAVNFGVIYGMGPQRLAAETDVTVAEAEAFIDAYFRAFPNVRAYQARVVEEARRNGYVTTLFGRRRHLGRELDDRDSRIRSQAERAAVNTPLQGTAADLVKVAMIRIDRRLREEGFRSRMLLQVHDELVFEAPPEEEERLVAAVRAEMTGVADLRVPLVVDVGRGRNWAEAH
jgi:DNA polymerase-1